MCRLVCRLVGRVLGGAWDLHPEEDRIITAELGGVDSDPDEEAPEIRDLVILNFHEWLRERVPR